MVVHPLDGPQDEQFQGHALEDEHQREMPQLPVYYIDYAMHKGKHSRYRHPRHLHREHTELIFVDYGTLKLTDEERDIVLGVGEGYVIPPETPHALAAREIQPVDYLNIGYRCRPVEAISRKTIRFTEEEKDILKAIKRASEKRDEISIQLLFIKLNELVLTLQERLSSPPAHDLPLVSCENTFHYQEKIVRKTLEYLAANHSARLDPEQVAVEVGVSYSYLRQILRKLTGRSLRAHLRETRLTAAEHMMRSGPYTAKEVAFACGYRSYPHFCTIFKEHFRMTPHEYMNSLGRPFRRQTSDNTFSPG